MKKLIIPALLAAIGLVGCGVGETPVEKVEVSKDAQPKADTMQGAIQNNPNMPDEAKKALLNQRGK